MRFFEAQNLARKNTRILIFLFLINVLVISGLNAIIVSVLLAPKNAVNGPAGKFVFFLSFAVFVIGTWYFMQKAASGNDVAVRLGGRLLTHPLKNDREKRLLNIIEEMAIASGVPLPMIYVLDHEPTINAFAAGTDPHHTVIAVTDGALQKLDRDELQAVIGHEYSHILNEDLGLNIKLSGVVMGFQILVKIGDALSSGSNRSNWGLKRSRGRGDAAVLGIAMMGLGWFGYLLGRILQSRISKEREYLADAASAQFTRNPEALARALCKVSMGGGSILSNPHRHELAHIFFSDAVFDRGHLFFSTHPPILSRIQKLVPDQSIDDVIARAHKTSTVALTMEQARTIHLESPPPTDLVDLVGISGAPSFQSLQKSRALLESSAHWKTLIEDPIHAKLALILITFRSQPNYQESLDEIRLHSESNENLEPLQKLIEKDNLLRTAMFQLSLATLRTLPFAEKEQLLQSMHQTFLQDQKISLLEALLYFNAHSILLPALNRKIETGQSPNESFQKLEFYIQPETSLSIEEFNKTLKCLRLLPMAQKKEFLQSLSRKLTTDRREEFRLLSMALQISIPIAV